MAEGEGQRGVDKARRRSGQGFRQNDGIKRQKKSEEGTRVSWIKGWGGWALAIAGRRGFGDEAARSGCWRAQPEALRGVGDETPPGERGPSGKSLRTISELLKLVIRESLHSSCFLRETERFIHVFPYIINHLKSWNGIICCKRNQARKSVSN